MRRLRILAAVIALALVSWSCQRLELYESSTSVNLNLNVDMTLELDLNLAIATDIENDFPYIFKPAKPEYMEALFYDMNSHQLVYSHIISSEGGIVSVAPGNYNIVIYNINTESTQVSNLQDQKTAEAYTTDITKSMAGKFKAAVTNAGTTSNGTKGETKGYEDDPIIYEPDHLFIAHEDNIHIPSFEERDKNVVVHATAHTILDFYSLEVIGIKGTENIDKVEAFITGQIKSNYFALEQRSNDPATLYIEGMKVDKENGRIYTVFGTFGKLAGADNHIYLDITVTNTDGGQYRYIYDVTDQFEKDGNNRLVIYDNIEIPAGEVGGGGLAPEVGDWEDETVDIPLG